MAKQRLITYSCLTTRCVWSVC